MPAGCSGRPTARVSGGEQLAKLGSPSSATRSVDPIQYVHSDPANESVGALEVAEADQGRDGVPSIGFGCRAMELDPRGSAPDGRVVQAQRVLARRLAAFAARTSRSSCGCDAGIPPASRASTASRADAHRRCRGGAQAGSARLGGRPQARSSPGRSARLSAAAAISMRCSGTPRSRHRSGCVSRLVLLANRASLVAQAGSTAHRNVVRIQGVARGWRVGGEVMEGGGRGRAWGVENAERCAA